MVDHLQVMGIQRWEQRNVVAKKALTTIETVASNKKEIDTAANDKVIKSLSAYAACSVRLDAQGHQSRWLWVLPQSSLKAEELQLIDKIVAATGSQWEFASIADTYLESESLDKTLSQELSAVIFLATEFSWGLFEQHTLFFEKQFIYADSAENLLAQPEKKRLVWQALQTLMV